MKPVHLSPTLALTALLLSAPCLAPAQSFRSDDPDDRLMRVFDLRDLLDVIEAQQGPADAGADGPEARREARRARVDRIATACATFVDPPLRGEETIEGIGTTHLACLGRPQQSNWVHDFLALQRRSQSTLLSLEARIWRVTPEVYGTLQLTDGPRALQEDELTRLTARLKEAGTDMLMAPKVLTAGLSEFSIATAEPLTYLRDFTLETIGEGEDRTTVANPQVGIVRDGMELRGILARLGPELIGLQCRFTLSEVERPFPTMELTLAEGVPPVTIQKPTVHRIEVDATAVAKNRHAILFPAPEFRGTHPVVVLLPALSQVSQERDDR